MLLLFCEDKMKINPFKIAIISVITLFFILLLPYVISLTMVKNIPQYLKHFEKQGVFLSYDEVQSPFSFMGMRFRLKNVNAHLFNQKIKLGDVQIDMSVFNFKRQTIMTTGGEGDSLLFECVQDDGFFIVDRAVLSFDVMDAQLDGFVDTKNKEFKLEGRANGLLKIAKKYISKEMIFLLSFVLSDYQQKITLDTKDNKIRINEIKVMDKNNFFISF